MAVFGLDGGGTRTRIRLADLHNATIWEGEGLGINPNACGLVEAARRTEALFKTAFTATGLHAADLEAGCLGIAGADRPDEKAVFESLLRGTLSLKCPLLLTADPDIALAGALKSREGIILIAGTGSVALCRSVDGGRFRAGGLGHFLGDEGSAFWIAFQGIARSLRSAEGRDLPTGLLEPLLAHFGLTAPEQFIRFIYREFDKARTATAAQIVGEARKSGDPLAVDIFGQAATELVQLVLSVSNRAGERLHDQRLAFSGGLFQADPWIGTEVRRMLAAKAPDITIVEAKESAVYGACLLAIAAHEGGTP